MVRNPPLRFCLIILTIQSAYLFFYGLGAGDLWRAENLRALVASELLRTGNWVVPTLYGQPLFSKPPGFYAAVAAASWWGAGVSEWTARLPSAVSALICVFLMYWYFARHIGRLGGLIAATILPLSLMWLDKATVAEIDTLHVAWTMAAILFFLRALEACELRLLANRVPNATRSPDALARPTVVFGARFSVVRSRLGAFVVSLVSNRQSAHSPAAIAESSLALSEAAVPRNRSTLDQDFPWDATVVQAVSTKSDSTASPASHLTKSLTAHRKPFLLVGYTSAEWCWMLAALACVAGGFLTKWTTPMFFYSTAITFLWLRGRLRMLLGLPHVVAAGLAASACLSWVGVAIALAGWDSFYSIVSQEAFARVIPGNYGGVYHWYDVLLYPLRIFATNLPWSGFALVALRPGFPVLFDARGRQLLQVLHAWLWPNLILWSFVAEHAPRHSFPMYPAISGLAAMVWFAWLTGRLGWPIARFRPAALLAAIVILWLVAKLVHVHYVIPSRNAMRQPRAKGAQIAAVVPADKTLFVFHLKDRDEGILFYYGRPVQRVDGPEALPLAQGDAYCLLCDDEWRELCAYVKNRNRYEDDNATSRTIGAKPLQAFRARVMLIMPDELQKPIAVARVERY
jgi:4-amino-4-deoxy-L-arabinose transferase-like glycosyltransferase